MARPDFSDYIVHFTSERPPIGLEKEINQSNESLQDISRLSAKERLALILYDKTIKATPTPWFNVPAVCFTECTHSSLHDNAEHYSSYGIGFSKEFLFNRGGGPVIYMRPDVYTEQQNFVCSKASGYAYGERFASFMVPFVPQYASDEYKQTHWNGQDSIDCTAEREWRLPQALTDFSFEDIAFVIVENNDDIAFFQELRGDIGDDKFLIMNNYEQIEKFCPVALAV